MKMPKIKITKTIVAGWLITASMMIVAVEPELVGAPAWLTKTLAIAALLITATLQSWRKLPPTVAEAHEALDEAQGGGK